jgi:hypothetical protein
VEHPRRNVKTSHCSFLGCTESAEAHHVHHVVIAVDLHRRGTLRELEPGLFSLGLLRCLLLCAVGKLLVADLCEPLVKVERFCLRRLLGLRAERGDSSANLLER